MCQQMGRVDFNNRIHARENLERWLSTLEAMQEKPLAGWRKLEWRIEWHTQGLRSTREKQPIYRVTIVM